MIDQVIKSGLRTFHNYYPTILFEQCCWPRWFGVRIADPSIMVVGKIGGGLRAGLGTIQFDAPRNESAKRANKIDE